MDLQPVTTIDGAVLRPGYRKQHNTNAETIRFQFFTVCDQTSPDRWHAEVTLFGAVILKTATSPTQDQALREAQNTLQERLVQLLGA